MGKRKEIDWEGLSAHYRAGKRTLRDIAQEYGTSEANIRKRAKNEAWPRDLAEKIKAKADDMVRKSLVRKGAQGPTENAVVEAAAQSQVSIRTEQMAKATGVRHLVEGMLEELAAQNNNGPAVTMIAEIMADPETNNDKVVALFNKIVSFGGRVDSAKKLTEAWAKAVDKEREVHGIAVTGVGSGDEIREVVFRVVRQA